MLASPTRRVFLTSALAEAKRPHNPMYSLLTQDTLNPKWRIPNATITCQTIFERTLSAVSVDPNTLNKSPKPGKL